MRGTNDHDTYRDGPSMLTIMQLDEIAADAYAKDFEINTWSFDYYGGLFRI